MPVSGPLVGVSAVVVRDGLVIVGRRKGSHGAGSWAFPGGKVEPGEDPLMSSRASSTRRPGYERYAWSRSRGRAT